MARCSVARLFLAGTQLARTGHPPIKTPRGFILARTATGRGQAVTGVRTDLRDRRKLGRQMRQYVSEFDPKLDRLLYGSDWIMLGKEPRNESYATDLVGFLKSEVGLTPQTMEHVLRLNTISFLGLASGNAARARLVSFYRRHELDQRRLEVFDITS